MEPHFCVYIEDEMWFHILAKFVQFHIRERNMGPNCYVILKGRNGGLILDANRSFWDMMEPHISSID